MKSLIRDFLTKHSCSSNVNRNIVVSIVRVVMPQNMSLPFALNHFSIVRTQRLIISLQPDTRVTSMVLSNFNCRHVPTYWVLMINIEIVHPVWRYFRYAAGFLVCITGSLNYIKAYYTSPSSHLANSHGCIQ